MGKSEYAEPLLDFDWKGPISFSGDPDRFCKIYPFNRKGLLNRGVPVTPVEGC